MTTDQAIEIVARLREYRAVDGRGADEFTVLAPLVDVLGPADVARAEAGGITHILTQPWSYYCKPDAPIEAKIDAMARFRREFRLDRT